MTAEQISTLLRAHRFTHTCEADLQRGVQQVLEENGIPYVREVFLSSGNRPDFLVDDSIVLELKVKGAPHSVMRQLMRYAKHGKVKTIILVTTKFAHQGMPDTLDNTPIHVVYLSPL